MPSRDQLILWGGLVVAILLVWLWAHLTTPAHSAGTPTQSAARISRVTEPAYAVGEFQEPEAEIQTTIDGKETIRLQSQVPGLPPIEVPVTALKLVAARAVQTKVGKCAGSKAYQIGQRGTRNRAFYRNPRVACAAFTAFCFRHCGRRGLSFSATQQYAQVRRRGGKLVAARVSTRYAPYYPYYRRGDLLFFHKGRRMGHVEISVGGGWTVGTSSSAGRVGRRRVGNRGFARMSVVRM